MNDSELLVFCVVCVCSFCPQVAKYPEHDYLTSGNTCPARQHEVVEALGLTEGIVSQAASRAWSAAVPVGVFFVVVVLLLAAGRFLKFYWWDLVMLKRDLERKGVKGPPFRLLVGNLEEIAGMQRNAQTKAMECISHDIVPRVFPYYLEWSKLYGKPFLMFVGPQPTLVTSDCTVLQEILGTKAGQLQSSWLQRMYVSMYLGEGGLVLAEGGIWKSWIDKVGIVNDALNSDRLNAIVQSMVQSVKSELFEEWDKEVKKKSGEVEVCKKVRSLSSKALSHTAFSSSHRKQGQKVFKKQMKLMEMESEVGEKRVWIPGWLPSPRQRKMLLLKRKIQSSLERIVRERLETIGAGGKARPYYGNDLLAHILSNSHKNRLGWDIDQIVGHCRNFFFAGYETCAIMLSWTLMLLGHYTEWQDKARAEIIALCGDDAPDASKLMDMKVLGMVLKESVRLYPPSTVLSREIQQRQASLKGMKVPTGLAAFMLVLQLHREPALWGDDALQFRPDRFADGLPKDLPPLAYLPFSSGRLVSVGQSYAVVLAKVVLSMFLQRYKFRLSDNYQHSPATVALRPQHGVPLILQKRLPDYPDPAIES